MNIDQIFHALGDPTRRALIQKIGEGSVSVSELAKPFEMSLAAVVQHLDILEKSKLIRTQKVGRVRTCQIDAQGFDLAEQWLSRRGMVAEKRSDRLGIFLSEED